MSPRKYAILASALFAAQAVFSIVHLIVGSPYPRFTYGHNVVIDVGLTTIWLAGAAGAAIRRGFPMFVAACGAVLVSLVHGAMFSLSTQRPYGLPFMVASIVTAVALERSRPAWNIRTPAPAR